MADKDKLAKALNQKKASDWSARNQEAFNGIMDINQFLPVTGDIQSGVQAAQDLKNKKYANALLNGVGLLPFVPSLGGTIKKVETIYHGTTPEAAKQIEKNGFDVTKSADGTIWFTSNPKIGEVGATGQGGIVKRKLDDKLKLGGWDETDKYSTDELLNMGYDGLKLKDSEGTVYQIFNPEKLSK
jgi:hypothetical protein